MTSWPLNHDAVRSQFVSASSAFVGLVAQIGADQWDRHALGQWCVRDLVGHTSRAMSTLEQYLCAAETTDAPGTDDPVLYYRRMVESVDHAAVAERGRDAGAGLGEDPLPHVRDLAQRVQDLVGQCSDSCVVNTPAGVMSLFGYLPTRTFELVVHSLDLSSALDLPWPVEMDQPVRGCLHLATDLAVESGRGSELLLTLTGRAPLRTGFTIL
jgi:uncharacterized protein (TIGR03083 family)